MIIRTLEPLNNAFIVKAVQKKLQENHRLQKLQDYYEGKQEILRRVLSDPTKPNNKVVVNYCKAISDFLTSYLVGVPVTYENAPQIIADTVFYNDDADTMQDVVLNMNTQSFGVELFYTDSDGIPRYTSIDPRESIFVTDDSVEGNLTAYIRVYPKDEKVEGYNVIVYTATEYTAYNLTLAVGELTVSAPATPHYFKDVPAIMYPNNTELIGTFEGIISLQDALNKLVSDELNDFEAFVDAYLVLEGMESTQPQDLAKMREDRILLLPEGAKAAFMIKNVNNAHIKELKEKITAQIRELGNIPDIENLGSFGSSGVAIQYKLLPTEIRASKQERILKKGIQRKLELLYNIFGLTTGDLGSYTDIRVVFQRNFIMLAGEQETNDLKLVNNQLMSPETFLVKNRGMTPEQAQDELSKIGAFE